MRPAPVVRLSVGVAAVVAIAQACVGLDGLSSSSVDDAGNAGDAAIADASRDGSSTGDGPASTTDSAIACTPGSCDSAHTCIDGVCQWIPTAVGGAGSAVFGVNVTDTKIIWSEISNFEQKAIAGGSPTKLINQGSTTPFTNDGSQLYWADNESVFTASILGGSATKLGTSSTMDSPITGVVRSGNNLYFPVLTSDRVEMMSAGGGPSTLCVSLPHPSAIALAGITLYVAVDDGAAPSIVTVPIPCAAATTLLAAARVESLFVAPPDLWWTTMDEAFTNGAVFRAPADGKGPATRIAVTKGDRLHQIFVTKDRVYFAAGSSVMFMPR